MYIGFFQICICINTDLIKKIKTVVASTKYSVSTMLIRLQKYDFLIARLDVVQPTSCVYISRKDDYCTRVIYCSLQYAF